MQLDPNTLGQVILMLLVPVGAGNDLLDCVPTAEYWQYRGVEVTPETMQAELRVGKPPDISALIDDLASDDFATREAATREIRAHGPLVVPQLEEAAKSDDAETAYRARMLMRQLGHGKSTEHSRRLMAIRALGEMGDRNALPVLRRFVDADEMFVAEYARRAIANIEGRPSERERLSYAELDKELWMLPRDCGTVGQLCPRRRIPYGIDDVYRQINGMITVDDAEWRQRQMSQLNQARRNVHQLIDALGNFRAEAMTFGVAEQIGPNQGFVVFSIRGLYDKARLLEIIKGFGLPITRIEGFDALAPEKEVTILFPSNERIVFVAGSGREQLPLKNVAKAINSGRGKLADNTEMKRLLDSFDHHKPVWTAMRVSEVYRELPVLKPLQTVHGSMERKGDKTIHFRLVAKGEDSTELASAFAIFENGRKEALREIEGEVEEMPALAVYADLLKSVEYDRTDDSVTVTAHLQGDGPELLLPMMSPFWLFGMAF